MRCPQANTILSISLMTLETGDGGEVTILVQGLESGVVQAPEDHQDGWVQQLHQLGQESIDVFFRYVHTKFSLDTHQFSSSAITNYMRKIIELWRLDVADSLSPSSGSE
jgi:hypothetical protein